MALPGPAFARPPRPPGRAGGAGRSALEDKGVARCRDVPTAPGQFSGTPVVAAQPAGWRLNSKRCDLDATSNSAAHAQPLPILACSTAIESLPETLRLRRDSERTCEVVQADDEYQTRDLRLGKPTLYQLSYGLRFEQRERLLRRAVADPDRICPSARRRIRSRGQHDESSRRAARGT